MGVIKGDTRSLDYSSNSGARGCLEAYCDLATHLEGSWESLALEYPFWVWGLGVGV